MKIITFKRRKPGWMKKVVLPLFLVLLISAGLLSMDTFSGKRSLSEVFNFETKHTTEHATKYSDCIDHQDEFSNAKFGLSQFPEDQRPLVKEINLCLEQYRQSLDSTIKNLSTIDAHEFLHNEYARCKTEIGYDSISEIKEYYHLGMMKICYDRDRALNTESDTLAKL